MANGIETAVNAFRSTLVEHGALAGAGESEAADVGRRAALLVGSGSAWRDHLGEFLSVRQVMPLLEVTTRQAVYDLVTRRRLLGLPRTGKGMAFPAFQFDPATGRPFAAVPRLLDAFAKAGVDSHTVATWLATPQDDLDGRSPMSLLGDPGASDALLVAAQRTAGRLSH